MQCGAVNGAEVVLCCLCDAQLAEGQEAIPVPRPARASTNGNLAEEVDWRSEVSQRLEAYRVRHGLPLPPPPEPQPDLFFAPPIAEEVAEPPATASASASVSAVASAPLPAPAPAPAEVHAFETAPARIAKRRFRPKRVERLEINVEQHSFDFQAADNDGDKHQGSLEASLFGYDSPAHSVAPLVERRRAGALDLAFLLGAYAAFLALFCGLGGRITFTRVEALVQLATLGLLYAQYVALFTYFARATPGMTLRGLRVVSLDGLEPSPRQLLWRSFGYLVSAGTMMLGFVWALWDEDQLSWHDRISQTCITTDAGFAGEPFGQASATR